MLLLWARLRRYWIIEIIHYLCIRIRPAQYEVLSSYLSGLVVLAGLFLYKSLKVLQKMQDLFFILEFSWKEEPVTVWSNPEVFRPGCFCSQRYIKVRVIVGILNQFQDMIEQGFFGFCLIAGFCCSFRYLKMFVVETECHCSENYVHALLEVVFLGVDLCDVVRTDLYSCFLEGAEVLHEADMGFECVVFFCGNRELIKV